MAPEQSPQDAPWTGAPPPPPPPPPIPPPPGVPGAVYVTTNGFAVAALVLGIVGPVMCVGWILALVFGYVGKSQIDASAGRQSGRGMAVAGIVLGWVWAALIALYFLIFIIAALADGSSAVG